MRAARGKQGYQIILSVKEAIDLTSFDPGTTTAGLLNQLLMRIGAIARDQEEEDEEETSKEEVNG